MEWENEEENMCYMNYNEETERQENVGFNEQNQLSNQENQNQTTTQAKETLQPLYKLQNIDTESVIKSEMKQLIATKVSEEINAKLLSDMTFEIEEQITSLRNRTEQLTHKNHDLAKEVESDQKRIAQSEETVLKMGDMITILKGNIARLKAEALKCRMGEILEKSIKQSEDLKSLQQTYEPRLKSGNERIKSLESLGRERCTTLKAELTQKQEALEDMIKKHEEFKKIISIYDDEIEKTVAKKHTLEQKLADLGKKKINIENEFKEQKDQFQNIRLKKENQIDKFTDVNKEKSKLEQQLEESAREIEEMKSNLACDEDEISQKENELKTLRNQLEVTKTNCKDSFEKVQQSYEETCCQLNDVVAKVSAYSTNNEQLLAKLDTLKTQYIQKFENKSKLIDENIKRQTLEYDMKLKLLKQQMETEIQRTKFEELQSQRDASVTLLVSLENDIITEKEKSSIELAEAKSKLEQAQTEHDRFMTEIKKKKEYLLANHSFYQGKSENLRHEVDEAQEYCKNIEEENISLKVLIQQKQSCLNERRNKLMALQQNQREVSLKSGLKSPGKESIAKKVKFSEILSFKSPSNSENSSIPADNNAPLETSFKDWFQSFGAGFNNVSKNTENIDQEF